MTVTSTTPETGRDDPLYAEGMAHLQAGEWQDAVRCFESLARKYPGSRPVAAALDEARFKARPGAQGQVRGRRWIVPWRTLILRTVVVAVLAFVAVEGYLILQRQVAPLIARSQAERRLAELLRQGDAYLAAGNFDAAEARYRELLALAPGDKDGQAGLDRLAIERQNLDLYRQAVALQEGGDYAGALEKLTDISVRAPGYRDVTQRIADIRRLLDMDGQFAAAEADYAAGHLADALAKYEQIRATSATYKRDAVAGRLFDLYMALGRELIGRQPPAADLVSQALDDFTRALALQPLNTDAATEQRLASLFVAGRQSYTARRWDEAASRLRAVYDERPNYLGGSLVVDPLYDAYIQAGDAYRGSQDYYMAWEQYRLASALPVADASLARGRMASVQPFLTPTPTPSPTATITPIPTATPYVYTPPTAVPSATPAPSLATFKGQILFWADREEQAGLWVMAPDGSNRRYLGNTSQVRKEYDDLRAKEALSPDGRFRVYNTQSQADKVPQIYIQGQPDASGVAPTWEVTHLSKLSYDPVWSPDGSRIAFVSQERTSDDIWTVGTDGKDVWNRTPNDWEWDKHPSWSPDSRQIVFWTNREGTKQLYVMDADGRDQHNISKVAWDEYDPLWVK